MNKVTKMSMEELYEQTGFCRVPMTNDVPDARIECDECHTVILEKRKRVGEVSIPPFFIAEHSHSSSFTVSIAEAKQKGEINEG